MSTCRNGNPPQQYQLKIWIQEIHFGQQFHKTIDHQQPFCDTYNNLYRFKVTVPSFAGDTENHYIFYSSYLYLTVLH